MGTEAEKKGYLGKGKEHKGREEEWEEKGTQMGSEGHTCSLRLPQSEILDSPSSISNIGTL